MCRLLGITNFDYSIHGHLVDNFCELARSGVVMAEDPPGHEDGWGMAYYVEGKLVVEKSGESLLKERARVVEPLKRLGRTPVLILHLRKSAWKDSSSTRHAHPFHHDNVVFAHNGTVYEYKPLLPEITLPGLGGDALDTEVFFYHIMSFREHGLAPAFRQSVARIKQGLRYSALNCLFSDGTTLYAYRDFTKEPDYYSLYKSLSPSSSLVCSEPLDDRHEWVAMEKGEFIELPAAAIR
ncbi:class II glutamine amidotransferase [Geomonas sp. Red32]|uniref:class II glutamine amidotransferase n=1 Tax=Geomonas sp. Red32 TaxID=2912856 RepID=UPI00202CE168|nr:class II glutamine amidotransferase [Geomonas sp. Red32]MCM0084399.1 class II glutamine amidotransferase [Geomonas sp. Red32]